MKNEFLLSVVFFSVSAFVFSVSSFFCTVFVTPKRTRILLVHLTCLEQPNKARKQAINQVELRKIKKSQNGSFLLLLSRASSFFKETSLALSVSSLAASEEVIIK